MGSGDKGADRTMPLSMQPEFEFHHLEAGRIGKFRVAYPGFFEKNEPFWTNLAECPWLYPAFPCFFYITDRKGQIVSSLRAYPDRVYGRGRELGWAWMGDLFTHDDYRGRGLGTMIAAGSREVLHRAGLPWAAVSANEAALRIYRKLGFTLPGYGSRYLMLKSARPFLGAHLGDGLLVRALGNATRPIFALMTAAAMGGDLFGPGQWERLFMNDGEDGAEMEWNPLVSAGYGGSNALSTLLWKTRASNRRAENSTSLYLLRERGSPENSGYFIVRLKFQNEPLAERYAGFWRMTLMDYGLFRDVPAIYDGLIRQLLRLFRKSSAEVLDVVTTAPGLCAALRHHGLIRVGKGESFVFSLPDRWGALESAASMEAWHFTPFTGDAFTF